MVDEFYGVLLKHWRFKNQPATGEEQSSELSEPATIEIPDDDDAEEDVEIDLTDILESVKVEDVQSDPYLQASLEDSAESVDTAAASEDAAPGAMAEPVSAPISEADLVAASVEPVAPKSGPEAVEVVAFEGTAVEPMAVEPVAVEPVGSCEKVDPLTSTLPCQIADDKKTDTKKAFPAVTALSDNDIDSRIDLLKYIRLDWVYFSFL